MKTYVPGFLIFSLALLAGSSEGQRGQRCITVQGGQGSCVPVASCQQLRDLTSLIRTGIAPQGSQALLRRSICHVGPREILVCCAQPDLRIRPPAPSPPALSPPTPNCGTNAVVDKIINGKPAPLRAWPWMVVLQGRFGTRRSWFCGGTLISSRFVLTAAHCFKEEVGVDLEFARIGEHNFTQERDCDQYGCAPPHQDIPVERIIPHPSYGVGCPECNDIALLKLSRDANIDQIYVNPICLPENPVVNMGYSVQDFQRKVALAAGWGTVSQDPSIIRRPNTLHEVNLTIQDTPFCQTLRRGYPDSNMAICAGGNGGDTCKGDSGGPLTLTDNRGIRHFVVGITSRGPLVCGSEGTQGLYTSVHYYLSWIQRTMRS